MWKPYLPTTYSHINIFYIYFHLQRKRSFSGSHSEPEPMEFKTSTPDLKGDAKSKDMPRSPQNSNIGEQNKTREASIGDKGFICILFQTSIKKSFST